MRILAVVLALGCAAGLAAADEPRSTAFGFDHVLHDRNLAVSGAESLPCARCHFEKSGRLFGKPGHAVCFGACHGPTPKAPARGEKLAFGDRAKICTSCHAEATQTAHYTARLAASYPPYTIDPDFSVTFGHKTHASAACTLCHDLRPKASRGITHERCRNCHDGKTAVAMSHCESCHPRAVGKPEPPALAVVKDSVSSTFSHASHAGRGAAGRDCATCHASIRATDDTRLPRPTAATCSIAGCHDAKAAFGVTVACTKCHSEPPREFTVVRPTARFEHRGYHEQLVKTQPCNTCHPLAVTGEVAIVGHAACAECHADDFGARKPKICGACHNASEPWRKLVADRALPERTEFGTMLDHDKHERECATCHVLRTAATQLRTPRGHSACANTGCHGVSSGPAPRFDRCAGCHRLGIAAAREEARAKAAWSVRAAFDHGTHRTAADGTSSLACTACHTQLSGNDLVALPTPAKATCIGCHDAGKTAFKLTGTTCSRCHRGAN